LLFQRLDDRTQFGIELFCLLQVKLTEYSTEFVEIRSLGHGDSGTESWCWEEQNKRVWLKPYIRK